LIFQSFFINIIINNNSNSHSVSPLPSCWLQVLQCL